MPETNNFDLLRLLFASVVVVRHCSDLSDSPALRSIPDFLSGRVAVEGFFTMSGFLVVASYERSRSLKDYFEKRARRILPLYWLVIVFGLVLGACMSSLSLRDFLRSPELWKYLFAQLSFANFLHPSLPGVFAGNLLPAVKGSLWTIKVEVMFYLAVPVIVALCRKLGKLQVLSVLFLLSALYRSVCEHYHHDSLAVQLPGQLAFFLVGVAVYYYLPSFMSHRNHMWLVALASYGAYFLFGGIAFRALGICLMTLCCGLLLPSWQGLTRHGDFSYGMYVFHWPVAQVLIACGLSPPGLLWRYRLLLELLESSPSHHGIWWRSAFCAEGRARSRFFCWPQAFNRTLSSVGVGPKVVVDYCRL